MQQKKIRVLTAFDFGLVLVAVLQEGARRRGHRAQTPPPRCVSELNAVHGLDLTRSFH